MAGWQSGYAAACKAVYAGSSLAPASCFLSEPQCLGGGIGRRKGLKIPRENNLCRFESGPGHQVSKRHLKCQCYTID